LPNAVNYRGNSLKPTEKIKLWPPPAFAVLELEIAASVFFH